MSFTHVRGYCYLHEIQSNNFKSWVYCFNPISQVTSEFPNVSIQQQQQQQQQQHLFDDKHYIRVVVLFTEGLGNFDSVTFTYIDF